ncbi:MAG TPA: galactose oxidase-like domain-containing protein, partial [Egibacteraceae bacterium]|nr:galactose oxidase-like domain-containing protein [Egibacteraceae bacterium]
ILFFTYKEPPDPHAPEAPQDHGDSAVLDLQTMTTSRPATLTAGGAAAPQLANLFCAGQAFLPDGRLLVAGGEREKPSVRGLHVFTPDGAGPGSWRPVGQLPAGRWYPTCATLRDGRVIIVAGDNWTPGSRVANKTFAVYDPVSGLQPPRPAPFVGEGGYATYPFVALLPNGKLLVHLGTRTRFLDTATLTFDPLVVEAAARPGRNGRTYHLQGTCVLLPLSPVSAPAYRARVMVFGGGGATPTGIRTPATATCEILDTGAATPQWQPTPPMTRPRVMPDAVLLPDGTVFVGNGSSTGVADNGANPVYEAELYDPATNTWRVLDQMRVPRLYHATALLLPDGRVMTAGTDSMWNPDPFHESQLRVELFSPPYLFRGGRPTIGGAPAEVGYGATFAITTSDPEQVAAVALLRAGSCTHSFNSDQRHVALAIVARSPATLTVQAPPNGNVAPPGHYLLFVLNGDGVPSEGRFVRLR